MGTETRPDVDLEELLDNEIPCAGVTRPRRVCDRAAQLRGYGHGCADISDPRFFKCVACWQVWWIATTNWIAENGAIPCNCGRTFYTADSYSDYRPF